MCPLFGGSTVVHAMIMTQYILTVVRAPESTQLVEAKQRKSAMLRASHHMQGNVITTGSKNAPKRTEHVRKPIAMHSMKVSYE